MVLSINGSESDGAGGYFDGTAIGVCSFERREGIWLFAGCRPAAARLPYGYGDFDGLDATIRVDGDAGTSVVVEWSKMATGERSSQLVFLRRVDGRFAVVLEMSAGDDTQGNYADRPDIETSWKVTWDFQKSSTSVPDIIATATGNRGVRHVDCKARFRFDGQRYKEVETSAGPSSCPWADEVPPMPAASAG